MVDTALTNQTLRAQLVSDPSQAAALRELFGSEGTAATGNVAVVFLDQDGIDGNRVTIELDNAPSAASVPRRARDERGIVANRRDDVLETTDGYRFTFADNQVRIDWPGREGGTAETRFRGNAVIEGDGTRWEAVDGNYVLPNGAMFTLGFDDDGNINDFTLLHGDSRVDVSGIGDGDPRIGRIRDGGYAFRMERVEGNVEGATFRMGGRNDGRTDRDITWNAEVYGQNIGQIGDDGIDPFAGYSVDPGLRPEFGSQDYERMIRAEIEDVRSILSGNAQAAGATDAYGDAIADYMLGTSGTYDRYANELQSSATSRENPATSQQQRLEQFLSQLFGGMPQSGSWEQGMQALQQLMQMYQQSQGMQNDYSNATSNLRSYIPSVQAAQQNQVDPTQLVEQIINGVGEQSRGQNNRNRLEAFDLANGGYQGPIARRGGADDSMARLLQRRVAIAGDRTRTDPRGALDVNPETVAAAAADLRVRLAADDFGHDDVERLLGLGTDERTAILDRLSPDERSQLGQQLTHIPAGMWEGKYSRDVEHGQLLGEIVKDAARHPELAQPILRDIIGGMDETDSGWADNILQNMQEHLGGGDISDPENRSRAAAHLRHAGDEVLQRMSNIHSEGNTDEDELEVLGQARGQVDTGEHSEAVSALLQETVRKVGDHDVDDDLIRKLSGASREERLLTLSKLSPEERQTFVSDDGADYEPEMGRLMADLVQDAQHDPRAQRILRDFVAGAANNDDGDDVLQYMQEYLGGGDIDQAANRQRAARALSRLDPSILDGMQAIHEDGWDDTSELRTLEVARMLQ